MPYADPEKIKAYQAAYRAKNRERLNQHNRAYHHATKNLPEVKARRKAYRERNKEIIKAKHRAWYSPEKQRERTVRRYGLTVEQFEAQAALQNHQCAICGTQPKTRLHIDHNHATGKRRALLCAPCNTSIGLMKENPTLLIVAAKYLEVFNGPTAA